VEVLIVCAVLLITLVLFFTEIIPIEITALSAVGLLIVTQVLSPTEALGGFSNPAPITVAAMLILGHGLIRTGVVFKLGNSLSKVGGSSEGQLLSIIIPMIAIFSAFISNTAAVAIFLPMILGIAREKKLRSSKLLIPLSYAAIMGGVCTYIGSSTNIIVGSIFTSHTSETFHMFEFTSLGVLLLVVGGLYMLTIGQYSLPSRPDKTSLTDSYLLRDYLTELVIQKNSQLINKTLKETNFNDTLDIEVLEIRRGEDKFQIQLDEIHLKVNDILIVKGGLPNILKLRDSEGVGILPEVKLGDADLQSDDVLLAEAVVSSESSLAGKTLEELNFQQRFQATTLAIRRHGGPILEKLGRVRLRAGDLLLMLVRKNILNNLRQNQDFLIVIDKADKHNFKLSKTPISICIFVGVIFVATTNLLPLPHPLMVAAMSGALLMVLTRCLTPQEAYQAVDWRIIILIGATLSLGKAMEETGTAILIANNILQWLKPFGPSAVLGGLYLITMALSAFISNNAAATLLTPIAISIASQGTWDPRPFSFCIAFAASCSFLTPIGYQTNTMVYGPGGYRFKDYLRAGLVLSLLNWVITTLLIPIIWPFH